MEVVYYWYHHGMAWAPACSGYYNDYKFINYCLNNHRYKGFMKMKEKYPDCLPSEATVYDENGNIINHIDITIPENFMLITSHDCECG